MEDAGKWRAAVVCALESSFCQLEFDLLTLVWTLGKERAPASNLSIL